MERCSYRSEITAKPAEKCGCWPLRKLQGKETGLPWNLPTPQFSPSETRVRLQNYRHATCVVETTKKEVTGYRSKWETNTGTVGSSETTTVLRAAASRPADPLTRAAGLRCSSAPSPETKHQWQTSHGCEIQRSKHLPHCRAADVFLCGFHRRVPMTLWRVISHLTDGKGKPQGHYMICL